MDNGEDGKRDGMERAEIHANEDWWRCMMAPIQLGASPEWARARRELNRGTQETDMSVFGFSTEPTGGDFLPIIKYDARAGRIFRVDRGIDGPNPTDITDSFTAVFDFANIETGWMNFSGPVP